MEGKSAVSVVTVSLRESLCTNERTNQTQSDTSSSFHTYAAALNGMYPATG